MPKNQKLTEQTMIDRLDSILRAMKISQSRFEKRTGIAKGTLASNKSRGYKEIGQKNMERILSTYPVINPDYLLLGNGEMFNGPLTAEIIFGQVTNRDGSHHNIVNQIHTSGKEKIIRPDGTVSIEPTQPQDAMGEHAAKLKEDNEALRRENADKDRKIAALEGELKSKNEFIQQLLGKLKG